MKRMTDNIEKLTTDLTKLGLVKVPRLFQLHVSASNKESFESLFSDPNLVYEERQTETNRFIATITVKTLEEYTSFRSSIVSSSTCSSSYSIIIMIN